MRGEFNKVVDIYNGPTSASAGTIRVANVPCRIVPDEAFTEVSDPLQRSDAYITMDEVEPIGPSWTEESPGLYEVDMGKGDLITMAGGTVMLWQVVRVEKRLWLEGEDYWRAHVAPYEAPTIGCETYGTSPWGIVLHRTGGTSWFGGDISLTWDPVEGWSLVDTGDDILYTTTDWDGHGTTTFTNVENPEDNVDVTCIS